MLNAMTENSEDDFDPATVHHYISVVVNKIRVMLTRVEEISQHDYTSPSPIALSEIVIRLLSRFLDYLRSWSQKVEYQPPADIIRAVSTINHMVVSIVPELIEAIEAADNDSPIASIIEAFEYIGNQVQYGTRIIIHSTWEYNASSNEIMQYLRKVTSSLGQEESQAIFSGAPQNFLIITYPKAEDVIVLRQALIAHELGHFIDESINRWSALILEQQLFNPKDVQEIVSGLSKQSSDRELPTKILQMTEKMIEPWIKEIVCDFLAISIIGPAYLFAFDEISFSPKYSYPQKLSVSHPPDQLRKAIMGGWITKLFIGPIQTEHLHELNKDEVEVFEKVVKHIGIVSRGDNLRFESIRNNEYLSENILAVVYSVLKNAVENAASMLQEQQYKSIENKQWVCGTKDILDAIKLQKLLEYGLTPTELYTTPSRSPSFPAVMNSGWFHFIACETNYLYFSETTGQVSNPDQVTKKYLTLQNLVAKAVESLHFKREYERRKGGSRG
jgi:hypothetical protein